MAKYCYLNGKIVPENEAKISISDLGVLRGYGAFDFLRTYGGELFLPEGHLRRFENSLEEIGLKNPLSKKETVGIIKDLMKKNRLKDAVIKVVVTGGFSQDGVTCDFDCPSVFILTKETVEFPDELYKKGIKMISAEHQREPAGAKTLNYGKMLSLQKKKEKAGATEILYIDRGYVREGATSNLFIFKGDKLITPKKHILLGMTRSFVIKLAKKHFKVEEGDIKFSELKKADEVFITATNKKVMPVVKIDNFMIGNGKVGEGTKKLIDIFNKTTMAS